MPKIGEVLFGKKAKTKQKSTLSPVQEELMGLLGEGIKSGEGALGDLFSFNEQGFQELRSPRLSTFKRVCCLTFWRSLLVITTWVQGFAGLH